MACDCCPRWPVATGVEEERAAGKFGSGARKLALGLKERSVEVGVVLLRARDRGLRLCGGLSTATRRWRLASVRGCCGARAGGHQGRGTGPGEEENDAWRKRKQEVDGDSLHSGDRRGTTAGGRAEQSRGPRARGRRREGRGPGDLFEIFRKFKVLSVNQDFSLLQRSNKKVPKMKVVEFFKLYNIVLGLKFRSSKFTAF
jgi:hypothetical protein